MPAKDSLLVTGDRYQPLTTKLHSDFIEKTGIDIPFKEFRKIIETTNAKMALAIAEEEAGIQLPENLGNIVVTKYKSKKRGIDWPASIKAGKHIPHLNLHSFGFMYHIKWFKMACIFQNKNIYKFQGYRTLTRSVAKKVKEGKKYFKWENTDMWSSTKMERRFNKFFKKQD